MFKHNNFCMHLNVKNKNYNSSLYFFFFESTYHLENSIRYLINACVNVKELIVVVLETTFAF